MAFPTSSRQRRQAASTSLWETATARSSYPHTTAPLAPSLSSVTLADLDGQHGLDIIAADPNDNEVWVLLNNGDGTFGPATPFATGSKPMDVVAADLGNGHVDIITANSADSTVSVLLGNGDGTFPTPHQDFPVGAGPVALAVGDLNNDGHPDVVTANTADNSLSILRGKGDGTFRSALDIPITVVVNNKIVRTSVRWTWRSATSMAMASPTS